MVVQVLHPPFNSWYNCYSPWLFSSKYANEVGCKNICFFKPYVVVLDLGLVGSIFNLQIPVLIVVLSFGQNDFWSFFV